MPDLIQLVKIFGTNKYDRGSYEAKPLQRNHGKAFVLPVSVLN